MAPGTFASDDPASQTETESTEGIRGTLGQASLDLGALETLQGPLQAQHVVQLLYEALETEIGGVQIYEKAIECAENQDLRREWQKYLEETHNHGRILREVFGRLDLNPEVDTPGRKILRSNAYALVSAMETAQNDGEPAQAQVVAAEMVVLAETKDHLNWELIGQIVPKLEGEARTALKAAHDEVEDQEDEHLYHTRGWARELWLEALGLPAVLPPPEERRDARTMVEAARAQKARGRMVGAKRGAAKRRGRTTRAKGGARKRAPARRQR